MNKQIMLAAIILCGFSLMACTQPASNTNADVGGGSGGGGVINVAEPTSGNSTKPADMENSNTAALNNKAANASNTVSKCELTKAPVLEGFYLGQTLAEIDGKFPGFKKAYELQKESELDDNKKANFVLITSGAEGVDDIAALNKLDKVMFIWHFLDEKLVALVVRYTDGEKSEISDEKAFVAKIAPENGLPKDGWKFSREQSADLVCQGFSVMASTHPQNGPSIMISDLAAEKERKKRGI